MMLCRNLMIMYYTALAMRYFHIFTPLSRLSLGRTMCPEWANLEKNLQVLKSQNNPVSANGSPKGGPIGGIRGFTIMWEDGPERARRADRAGVLPHAPLVGNLPDCALRGVN